MMTGLAIQTVEGFASPNPENPVAVLVYRRNKRFALSIRIAEIVGEFLERPGFRVKMGQPGIDERCPDSSLSIFT